MIDVEMRQLTSEDFKDEDFIRPLLDMGEWVLVDFEELRNIFEKRKETSVTYIALVDGKIVGMAALLIWHSFTGRSLGIPMDVYVKEKYRKQGIGKKFLDVFATYPVHRLYGPVGKDLVQFYQGIGYQRMDVVYMERNLKGV